MNIANWLQRAAILHPDRPAIFEGKLPVADYAEFSARAAALAAGLRHRHEVEPGDRVGIFLSNHIDYLPLLFGIWWAGAVAVPINAKLHPREAEWILDNAGVRLAFASDLDRRAIAQEKDDLRLVALECEAFTELLSFGDLNLEDRGCDELAWLFYTSGTTGRPKGVMLSHGNLIAMTHAYLTDVDTPQEHQTHVYAAPMSHGAGLYALIHVLLASAHVIPADKGFRPEELMDLALHFGDLSFFAVPTMVKRLTDYAAKAGWGGEGISMIVYGGGPMYLADIEAALAQFGPRFAQIYGQGESPMTITTLSRHDIADRSPGWRDRLASVGRPFSGHEVRIVDGNGNLLPPGEIGEITVRGAAVMQGYWNDPEATAATLRDHWLWTGDMGVLTADGFLTLKDRSKDVIISGGTNIYPREVEEVLLQHPDVAEVCVIGTPNADWGEVVTAFVVARDGQLLTAEMLDSHCVNHIARFKRPKSYWIVQALPKSDYGKILKSRLRDELAREVNG